VDAASERNDEGERNTEGERNESPLERLDRNTVELLNELRVAGTGIQVLFAFLLIVPFNAGWRRVSSFERYDYFVTLLCVAIAATLLIAPSVHHRLLFRRGEKEYLVSISNRFLIVASVFLSVGLTGILVLITDFLFGGAAAAVVGTLTALFLATVWFAIPLQRRQRFAEVPRGSSE
jgi:O-antigen/teichoic acid export membrane protein